MRGVLLEILARVAAPVEGKAQMYIDRLTRRLRVALPDDTILDIEHTGRRNQPNGYPGLDSNSLIAYDQLGTGTPDGTKFLRDDQVWAVPSGGGGGTSDHALLSHLAWTASAHTGTASRFAVFGSGGAAAELAYPSTGLVGWTGSAWQAVTVSAPLGYSAGTLSLSYGYGLTTSGGALVVDTSVIAEVADLAGYQPLDADLTALAALGDGLPYRSSGSWGTANPAGMLSVVGGAWKVVGLREGGGTDLSLGAISDGEALYRDGTSILSAPIGQVSSLNAAAKFWFQIRMDGSAAAGVGTAVLVGQNTGSITYRGASSVVWPDVGLAGTAAGGNALVRTNNQICRPDQSARHSFAVLCSSGTANLRVWCVIGSIGGGDTPSGAAMGLVYNPNVSANWQVFCYAGSGSVYYADTGHAYTAGERVEVSFLATASGCTGKIRTAGGTWSTEQTVTSGVPSSSTAMYHMFNVSRIAGGTTAAATAYFVGSSAEVSYA